MNISMIVVLFIVSLFVLISLHELGHFVTAKRAGVKVEEFGLGFPPRLFGIKRGETIYSVNAIPIGAFVKTPGENDPTVPGGLASKGPWTRLSVYAAGPLVNVFLAFILLSAFFMLPTNVVVGDGVMVHSVAENSPAEEAGIKPGNIILKANGKLVYAWSDLQNIINSSEEGKEITLLLQRDGNQDEISLKPEFDATLQRRAIGVLLWWNMVSHVEEGSPACQADIRPEDTILSINEHPIYSSEGMSRALSFAKEGERIYLILLRGEEAIIKELDTAEQLEGMELRWVDNTRIEQEQPAIWKAAYLGGRYIIHMPSLILEAIPLIKADPGMALVGPIGAGQLTVEAVKSLGADNMLFMASIVSLGLALFNFLPIPPLDGGGMLVAFIEGFRHGKRLSPWAVRLAYTVGTALLMTLMIAVTFNDILRLIRGEGFGL